MPTKPIIMGIINATPDSFYDGGQYKDLIQRGLQLINDGADWLDIGGESTRPNAQPVSIDEEINRVIPLIEALHDKIPISIDTTKPEVARVAAQSGANILNDVRGLQDAEMISASALFQTTIVMHSRGTPKTMMSFTQYESLITEITNSLCKSASMALSENVWIDPGIGFAKTAKQSISRSHH